MFHAHVRTAHDAFHLIAEVNSYNLQTLRQHMRQSIREDGQVKISVRIDSSDQPAFARHTANWLPKLIAAGTQVEVVVATPCGDASADAEAAVTAMTAVPTAEDAKDTDGCRTDDRPYQRYS